MNNPQINIIIPLYNEEQVFEELIKRLKELIKSSEITISIILIDDGSSDSTPLLMRSVCLENEDFNAIFLSRNFGHERALSAGLSYVTATEAVFIIDGDLQDPPELIFDFYQKVKEGYDVVYAIRQKRKENLFKRTAYKIFYKILNKLAYIEIPLDSGDFCMITPEIVSHINEMPEESRFLRGMRSWVGFSQVGLEYERHERFSGDSKYPLKNLIKLALNGLFNFSEYPIKFISKLGITTLSISIVYFIYTLIKQFFFNGVPEGFTALFFLITLFGGAQLLAIGIIGEYILRIFFQVKKRPLFIVKKTILNCLENNGK